jgi:hypothetical protein
MNQPPAEEMSRDGKVGCDWRLESVIYHIFDIRLEVAGWLDPIYIIIYMRSARPI